MVSNTVKIVTVIAVIAVVAIGVGIYAMNSDSGIKTNEDGLAVNTPCDPYTFTDLAGQTYTFDHHFGAVCLQMSLQGGAFSTMADFFGTDLPKYIAGLDDLDEASPDLKVAWYDALPELKDCKSIGWIGYGEDPAHVLAIKPNALIEPVIMKDRVESTGVASELKKAGIPIIYIDFHGEDVEKIKQSIKILGMMFGKEKKADKLATEYATKANAVYDKVRELLKNNPRPSAYSELATYGSDTLGHSYGNDSMWGALLYRCGGENLLKSGQSVLDTSYILSSDPDVIIFVTGHGTDGGLIPAGFDATEDLINETTKQYFDDRPGWKELSAYKEGHVYVVSQSICRELCDYVSIEFLAKCIWPEEFEDVDPMDDLKDYYKNHTPVKFKGVWYQQVSFD